jgi:hypothetical protein
MSSPLRTSSSYKVDSLREAARVALRTAGPLRVSRQTEHGLHELFFYRDIVIHAEAEDCSGVAAIRRMLANHAHPFTLESGRWPARHTMLIEWSRAMKAVRSTRPVPRTAAQPVRYVDESEATTPLGIQATR